MKQRLEIGGRIRVSRYVGSRHRGKPGLILEIERNPKGQSDWDICAVYLGLAGTHQFPSAQLEKVEQNPGEHLPKAA